MKIKDRIALYFTLICTTILFAVLFTVYFTFMKFLQADFFERLTDRTMVTAKLYLEADEISRDALNSVRHKYLQKLNGEVTRIYNYKNEATFIGDSAQYWPNVTIEQVRKKKHLKYIDGERQVVGIYYKDNQGDFVILASAEDQGSHNRLNKLLQIMVVIFILITAFVLLLSRWVAEKMLMPLNKFMIDVKQIDSKKMAFRVEEKPNNDEINQLAKTFNALMADLEQAFILQKTFVANASHELRTPLTRMITSAELALLKERKKEDYQKYIQLLLEESEKMEHIVSGLLALAKMDMQLINALQTDINVEDLITSISEEWNALKNQNLVVTFQNNELKSTVVCANKTLITIAINNIISNAFKFSANQQVDCYVTLFKNELLIKIVDKGSGILQNNINQIFKPFYTNAESVGLKGEGMGLYMAQKIVEIYKGEIEVSSSQTMGSAFTIKLPAL